MNPSRRRHGVAMVRLLEKFGKGVAAVNGMSEIYVPALLVIWFL